MNRPALQIKQVGVSRMAFRARKVFGSFEKRAPGLSAEILLPDHSAPLEKYIDMFFIFSIVFLFVVPFCTFSVACSS